MKNLSELAKQFKTDKGVGFHDYTEVYDTYLNSLKNEKLNFLEIGVFTGESLKMWEAYFKNGTIIGLDINPDCAKYAGDRRKVYIGSQVDDFILYKIQKENAPLSVIIDDGSHQWQHQIKTFNAAFPLLKPGGLYFIEDLHTSYTTNPEWAVGNETGVEFTKTFVDDVNLRGKSFMGYQELAGKSLTYNEHHMEYVHFYRSLCVVKKREEAL
jgi:predicted O-methyltransferase YrrM